MERPSSLTRRVLLCGAAILLAAGLTACSGQGPVGAAPVATIGSDTISFDDLKAEIDHIDELVAANIKFEAGPDGQDAEATKALLKEAADSSTAADGKGVPVAASTQALTRLIDRKVSERILKANGEKVTDEDRAGARDSIQQQLDQQNMSTGQSMTLDDVPAVLLDDAVERMAMTTALGRAVKPTAEDLRGICVDAVETTDQDKAAALADRLRGGEQFAKVFEEVMGMAPQGEAVGGCLLPSQLEGYGYDISDLSPGTVLEPSAAIDEGRWIVAQVVRDATASEAAQSGLAEQVQPALLEKAMIAERSQLHLNPRYGTLDAETGTVTPPTDPAAPVTANTDVAVPLSPEG